MTILGTGILSGALIGGMSNPLLLFVGIAGLVFLYIAFQNVEWGVLLLVFIYYTLTSEVLVHSHGLPSAEKYTALLLLLLLLARWFLRGERPEGTGFAIVLLSAYGLFLSLAYLYAVDIDRTTTNMEEYIKNAAVIIIIVLTLKRGDMLRYVTYTILAGGLFLGTISTYQYLTGTFDNNYWGFAVSKIQTIVGQVDSYRIGGPIGDPNFYAQVLLFVVPLALDRLLKEQSMLLRIMAACAFAVTLLSIAFTFSRGAFLGVGIVLLLFFLKNPPRPAVLLAMFAAAAAALFILMPDYVERMYTMVETMIAMDGRGSHSIDTSIQGRLGEMRVALQLFLEHPLLGVGYGNYEHYYQQYSLQLGIPQRGEDREAHSLYLELAAEQGILGLGAYFMLFFFVVRTLLRSRRMLLSAGLVSYADLVSAYGYSLVGYFVTAMFLHARCKFIWVVVGICLSLPRIAAYETNRARHALLKGDRRTSEGNFDALPAELSTGSSS
jgi:putative inorganic carbon (HCO3(-)) transporter